MEKKRSIEVKVIGGIFLLMTIPALYYSFTRITMDTLGPKFTVLLLNLFCISIPIGLFSSGVGLLRLKKYGRFLGIIYASISLLLISLMIPSIFFLLFSLVITGKAVLPLSQVLGLALIFLACVFFCIFAIHYLTRPNVKEQFK